jgi:DNA-binding CsgD family transcriptional regulator
MLEAELAAQRAYPNEREAKLLLILAGIVAAELGDHARARAACADGLVLGRQAGDTRNVGVTLEAVAWVAAAWGEPARAIRLAAAAQAVSTEMQGGIRPLWRAAVAHRLEPCRQVLGETAAGAAWAEGQAMTLDEAIAYARATLETVPAPAGVAQANAASGATSEGPTLPTAHAPGGLSAREREVAALVAQGLTSRQIAAALVISRSTAQRHVEHVMAKLGVHSRAQIATWVSEHGLLARALS